jgi:hypothetical protein
MKRFSVAVSLAILTSACEGRGAAPRATPTGPSLAPQAVPQPVGNQLAGLVFDSAFRPLAGARVEVLDGPQAGTSTMTDARGQFRLTGTFDDATRFTATKDGHIASTGTRSPYCAACNPNWWIHLLLAPVGPPVDLAGNYTLTFSVDGGCVALPDDVRTRTYAATIAPMSLANHPVNTSFELTITGSPFLDNYKSFWIFAAGDYISAELGDAHGAAALVEEVAANTYLTFGGSVVTLVTSASTISTSLDGFVEQCQLTSEWGSRRNCSSGGVVARAECISKNHRLILTRR